MSKHTLCRAVKFLEKSLTADRDLSGEAVIRLAHDPSPPVLSPVRLQTPPVLSDSNTDDAEQRQEHAYTTPESGTLTIV